MSTVDPFNTLGGYSVGIPPELVIDAAGNIVNNVNAPNSNVTANRVFANGYFYANGDPLSIGASGSNRQVQYNNNGLLGASAAFTFNSTTNLLSVTNLTVSGNTNLGNIGNVKILGGNNGLFLQTDGTGNLTWAPAGNGGGGNGSPAGANTQVQFNNQGNFGGDPGFTYDSVLNLLTVQNILSNNITSNVLTANANLNANIVVANFLRGDGSNISNVVAISAAVANSVAGANVTGQVNFANVANNVAGANVSGQVNFANVANNVAGANISGQVANALVAGTVYIAAQPNITSVGNLTSLTVTGNTTLGNQVTSNFFIGNLFGVANLARNVTLSSQPNITSVGVLTSLTVSGNSTLGNSVTANFFVGNLFGTANNALTSNLANVANRANLANLANAAILAGTVTDNAQPNITSIGNLTNLTVTGNSNLGDVSKVKITGGVNGYVLSTDGTGNLSWVVGGNGGGNGIPGGSNTQIQYNDSGTFAGNSNFTWNNQTRQLTVNGNLTVDNIFVPNIVGTIANITTINASGNITAGNINGGNSVSANFLSGTLTTATQLGINYVGNLGWLNVDTSVPNSNGNITFNGSLNGVGAFSDINITGNVNAGNFVEAEVLIGRISTSSQPLITSLGNLSTLTVTGVSNLGNVGNFKLLGGNNGFVLSTDGTGNLSWIAQANGGGNASPGGLNTYIQFNDNGTFGGDNTLTWNKNTDTLFVGGNANVNGVLTSQILVSNVATGSAPIVVTSTTPVANLGVQTAATVRDNAQPNITSIGTLTSLAVSGNTTTSNLSVTNTFNASNISVSGTIGTTNLNVTGLANLSNNTVVSGSGNLVVNGRFNSSNASLVQLGNVSNVKISGGINGYVLTTDGAGNLSWSAGGGGGNGTPGGSNTQIQYNKNGVFAGSAFLTFNDATNNVQIAGNLIANSFTMGAGIYQFSQANVYFATTSSDTPNQPILSIEADGVAAVDYTIISTENAGNIRNLVKVSTVIYGNVVNYVEYSTLPVNGYIGDFTVSYDAGSITDPPTIQLRLSPQTANSMVHKIMVTRYNE